MEFYIEEIKKSFPEIIVSVNNLLRQLNGEAHYFEEKDMKDMLASPASSLFVARRLDNKEIIAMLTMILFRIPFVKKGLIEDLVVDSRYRGKGIGTKLIKTAINKAKMEETAYLDFTSRPERVEANKLYQHLGFKKRETNIYRITL